MKKFYILAGALTCSLFSAVQAQETITFETITLANETYDNGSDGSGDFTIGSATFENVYNTDWSYMESGFAVSNTTDNTTAGYLNQYSAYTGSGDNSENYSVCNPNGTITFDTYRELHSIKVTNTTYAALSMLDGDQIGKQFGSTTNALGEDDGTNGEDYFILHIIPLDENDELVNDTIDFYLADYRFADNNQDYIVDTWVDVNLGNIHAKSIRLEFSSSDVGEWGINTPTYVAIDNLVTSASDVSVTEKEITASVYPNPCNDELTIATEGEASVTIVNLQGNVVSTQDFNSLTKIDLSTVPNGVYFARITINGTTVVNKFVKQ